MTIGLLKRRMLSRYTYASVAVVGQVGIYQYIVLGFIKQGLEHDSHVITPLLFLDLEIYSSAQSINLFK